MSASPPKPRRAVPSSSLHTERSLLPIGITTILPDAAARVRALERTLLDVLETVGALAPDAAEKNPAGVRRVRELIAYKLR